MFKNKSKYQQKSVQKKGTPILSGAISSFGSIFRKVFRKIAGNNKQLAIKILVTIFIIVIYRFMSAIPLPGVDMQVYQDFFGEASASEASYLFLIFTGARLDTPSIVGLGLAAYINASIIMQLLTPVVPKLEELSKEGERGKQVINQWTRFLTLPLSFVYSVAYLLLISQRDLNSSGNGTTSENPVYLISHAAGSDWPSAQKIIFMALVLTAGSMLLMWLAELITERGIGNGSSIVISIGIISSLPSLLQVDFSSIDFADMFNQLLQGETIVLADKYFLSLVGVILGLVLLIVAIVFVNESVRKIDIQYARRVRTGQDTANSELPIKLTLTGVLPMIFASALMSMPQLVVPFLKNIVSTSSQFYGVLTSIEESFLFSTSDAVVNWQDTLYSVVYFLLIVAFGVFYAFVVMKPADIAENLQKSGAFIPGIRPGQSTENFVTKVLLRISFAGSIFLGLIALMPLVTRNVIQSTAGINLAILSGIGGTSILIVVSVVLESKRQYDSMKVSSSYERYTY